MTATSRRSPPGTVKVLVATDVAARGVHVDNIELVIHVDPPAEHKAYLHRSGRTARAGEEGDVVTVVLPAQRSDTASLLRKAAITVTPQRVTAKSDAVAKLVGDVAEYVKPAPRAATPERGQSQGGRSQGANAQRKRANRDERGQSAGSGAPRRDRSGRPARDGSGRPATAGNGGCGNGRRGQSQGRPAATYSTSTGRPGTESAGARLGQDARPERSHASTDAPRARQTGSRRAGAATGQPKFMVGSVVRSNGGGQRRGGGGR